MAGPKSGRRLRAVANTANMFPDDSALDDLDDLVVDRIATFYKRVASHLRELEAYKLKRGICIGGISCTRKAVEGPLGGMRTCPHHAAAQKAGMKLRRWEAYSSEYGRLRKKQIEEEKAAKLEAEREKEREKIRAKVIPKKRSAA